MAKIVLKLEVQGTKESWEKEISDLANEYFPLEDKKMISLDEAYLKLIFI